MSYFYEAGAVEASWNGLDLSEGWGEDTFLNLEPNADRIEHAACVSGEYTFSKISDKGCTIEMTFKDVAPINKKIANIHAAQDVIGAKIQVSPFKIIDHTGDSVHFLCLNCVLVAVPPTSFQRVSGERTWRWVAQSYLMAEDPATITATLDQYLPQSTNLQSA